MGSPVGKNDSIKTLPQEMDNDWQDPELLGDIEAATAVSYTHLTLPTNREV